MYMKRVRISNIRCFEEVCIDFDEPGSSVVLTGDNGFGKSTLLRCMAMGLCDESGAAALLREVPGKFIRRGSGSRTKGEIEIDLVATEGSIYHISTSITPSSASERVSQRNGLWRTADDRKTRLTQDSFPWDHIWACGYGPGIRVRGTSDYERYSIMNAVYPLFRYDVPLQNPELVVRRLWDELRDSTQSSFVDPATARVYGMLNALRRLLVKLLGLSQVDDVELTRTGIEIQGPWGKAGLKELGDGYRSVITWVLDLISWWFLTIEASDAGNVEKMQGIVFIDEIEQHLHPRWQRSILCWLKECFPHIQFIATTHSPLVISGCQGVKVHHFQSGEHTVEAPFGWLAEDVYSLMGLTGTRSAAFNDIVDRYAALHNKKMMGKLTEEENADYADLTQRLSALPESDPVALTTRIDNVIRHIRRMKEEETQ